MPADEIYDPIGYSPWWAALGVVAILAAAAVAVLIVVFTRARRPEPVAAPLPRYAADGEDPFGALRAEYLARVDALARKHREGALDDRALHLAISAEMRGFASRRLGVDTSAMTLSEIESLRFAAPLSSLIAHNYRPSFADGVDPGTDADPAGSIQMARTAVERW